MLFTLFHHPSLPAAKTPSKLYPTFSTTSVPGDSDDCAIWVHPKDPMQSVIIGNDKTRSGALYVWDLEGNLLHRTETINRPVNIDVRQQIPFGEERLDIIACGVRGTNEIRLFTYDPEEKKLIPLTVPGQISSSFDHDTYGFCLYYNHINKKLYGFVSQKAKQDIHQVLISKDDWGRFQGSLVRSFGGKKVRSFVEGMVADDECGYLYCADEREGVLKFLADPDLNDNFLQHKFALGDGITGDREGLALYKLEGKSGYILLSSQEDHTIKVYSREGNNEYIATIYKSGSLETDGVAANAAPMSPLFPKGILVCHNDRKRNFVIYSWEDVEPLLQKK